MTWTILFLAINPAELSGTRITTNADCYPSLNMDNTAVAVGGEQAVGIALPLSSPSL
jgi:hypothetical protein